jgi:hypothetical protein
MARLWRVRVVALGLICALPSATAGARTLEVGPGKAFRLPSEAAQVAQNGDVVEIAPGNYADCAVWTGNNLTIEASGPGVILSEKTCAGKGIFVIDGSDVIVRGLTFQRAAVPARNGAGIRAEGGNLTVEHSTFFENEMGILATGSPAGTLIVRDSLFARNGNCYPNCRADDFMHALYVGRELALFRVERSEFTGQHDGHYVKSRAVRSEILNNVIHDGGKATSSYLIDIPDGGAVIATGNRLEKGPGSENSVAIAIGEESQKNATPEIRIENNSFSNKSTKPAIFVWNMTKTEPLLRANVLEGKIVPLFTGPKK